MPEDKQWRCDLGEPSWRVGEGLRGEQGFKGDVGSNCAQMNERTATSSRRRSRGITFVSTSRMGTGEDRKAQDARRRGLVLNRVQESKEARGGGRIYGCGAAVLPAVRYSPNNNNNLIEWSYEGHK